MICYDNASTNKTVPLQLCSVYKRYIKMWKILITCFLWVVISLPQVVHAVGAFQPTENELQLLPSYCRPKAAANTPINETTKRWFNLFGPDYKHMHHYCRGLVSISRGDNTFPDSEAGRTQRKFHYNAAIREFTSTKDQYATKNFKLLPELFVKRGDAYSRLNDDANAEVDYLTAYNRYPKYPVAYMKLVDLYLKQGRVGEAKAINDAALKRFSKKKAFIRRADKIKKAER